MARNSRAAVLRQRTDLERPGVGNAERWQQILAAAAEEFYEKGYRAARLQDIGERVGLLTGSLYHYIRSKDELLFALVSTAVQLELATAVENEDAARAGAKRRLQQFVRRQLALLDEHRALVRAVQRDLPFLGDEDRARMDSMKASLRDFVRGIIEEGIRSGEFRADADVDVAINSLFALVNSTPEWARSPGRRSMAEIGDWYTRVVVCGLQLSTT